MDDDERFHFIINHLELAQKSTACHMKEVRTLKRNLENVDLATGIVKLGQYLQIIFISNRKEKNPYVSRAIKFMATFCTLFNVSKDSDSDCPYLTKFLEIIFEYVDNYDDNVRYWSCVLIEEILYNLKDLSNESFHRVQNVLMERLNDPKTDVRIQAIQCLHVMQNEEVEDDPIIEKFSELMQSDMKPKVRAICCKVIIVQKSTLPLLVTRVRDVSGEVQLIALSRLSSYMPYLTITQRREVITNATDSEFLPVENYFSGEFFEIWLKSYKGDFKKLMKSIQLYADEEDITKTCRLIEVSLFPIFRTLKLSLLNLLNLNTEKTIDFKDLTIEVALYWRMLIEYLIKSPELFEDSLELTLPDVPIFCNYINAYWKIRASQESNEDDFIETQFILKQLFLILKLLEITDPACAKSITTLIEGVFKKAKLTENCARVIMENLERTIADDFMRSEFVCLIVSNIRFRLDEQDEIALSLEKKIREVSANLKNLKETQARFAKENNFLKAADLDAEIRELQLQENELRESRNDELVEVTDVETLSRALVVLEALLASPKLQKSNPALSTILKEFVLKMTVNPDEEIQATAMKCYCAMGIIHEKTAMYAVHIFAIPISAYHAGEEVSVTVLLVCITAVCDLLMMYGPRLVATQSEDSDVENDESIQEDALKTFTSGTSLSDLLQGLADLLDDENLCLQKRVVICLVEILSTNAIHSNNLLARLIVKWANPATDDTIRCGLGEMLQRLHAIPGYTKFFTTAAIPIIEIIADAPPNSPLTDIDVNDIVNFLVALTFTNNSLCHSNLAVDLCDAISHTPTANKQNAIYCKILLKLKIDSGSPLITTLLNLCDDLRNCDLPRNIMKDVLKFCSTVTILDKQQTDKKSEK